MIETDVLRLNYTTKPEIVSGHSAGNLDIPTLTLYKLARGFFYFAGRKALSPGCCPRSDEIRLQPQKQSIEETTFIV